MTAADRVLLNTPRMQELFLRAYPDQPKDKFVVIPNGIDPEQLAVIQGLRAASQPSRNGPLLICHPGALYGHRDPRPLLLAVKQLADAGEQIAFQQVGTVEPRFALETFIAEQRLEPNVQLQGQVAQLAALRAMAAADLLLIVQPGTSIQVPAKLYEMIPFEKLILALAEPGATADLITRYDLGIVADPHDVDAITAALRRLIDTDRTHTRNHHAAIQAFDGRKLTADLADTLNACLGRTVGR